MKLDDTDEKDASGPYRRTDAWLLLAIFYAETAGLATRERIIAAGNFINHAIFNEDELDGGLSRLIAGGFVQSRGGGYETTSKARAGHPRAAMPHGKAYKDLEEIEGLLGVR
jgi:hypothetical protein